MKDASLATAGPSAGSPRDTSPRAPGAADEARAVARGAKEVAHDLNNLLTVILGGAAALRDELSPTELREVAAEIDEAGRRAIDLTRRLLVIARRADGAEEGADVTSIGLQNKESP